MTRPPRAGVAVALPRPALGAPSAPRPVIVGVYNRAAGAARPGSPIGDPEPAAPRPGPRLVPDVLGAVVANAAGEGAFSTFARAVHVAGVTSLPGHLGEFTIFAPTDRAFAKLPGEVLEALFRDTARLARLVMGHVVPHAVRAPRPGAPLVVRSLEGGELTIDVADGTYRVNGARLVKPHIHAANGTVRGIDTVLVPA